MSNKQAQKQSKIPINARITPEAYTNIQKYAELHGLPLKQQTQLFEHIGINLFQEKTPIKEQTPSKASIPQIPENCKSCPLHGVLVQIKGQWKMICILKEENKQPNIEYHELVEAEICSTKPIYISKATQGRYENHIEILNGQLARAEEDVTTYQKKDDYYAELRKTLIKRDEGIKAQDAYEETLEKNLKAANRKLEPMESLLGERDGLKSEVKEMKNGLLERDGTIAILQTDNGYKGDVIKGLCEKISKLSESEILKEFKLSESKFLTETDSLHTQLNDKCKLIDDYGRDIEKLEALTLKQKQTLSEAISQMKTALREFRLFLPTSNEPQAISEYIRAMQKKIENLEGYLQTISI